MKTLVAYFSATGRTRKISERIAEKSGADIYEIKPAVKYTKADLNWMDKNSRTTIEMNNKDRRPDIVTGDIDISAYDTIYLGFPIWWYVAPTVINAFLEAYNFSSKRIIIFATSGGSKFGDTLAELKPSATGAELAEGKIMNGIITDNKIEELIKLGVKT